jgi:UPF0271 protein
LTPAGPSREDEPELLGDGAVRVALPEGLEPADALEALRAVPEILDAVVTERFVAAYFDTPPPPLGPMLRALPRRVIPRTRAPLIVRARYDGPDLEAVAAYAQLTPENVVRLHTAREYTVRMIGFLPGFAYLGDVDPRLSIPRRRSPRVRVPARAVGIAARYTAVYPFESSGGWHLLGEALDFAPFDPARGALLSPGDRIRFEAVP